MWMRGLRSLSRPQLLREDRNDRYTGTPPHVGNNCILITAMNELASTSAEVREAIELTAPVVRLVPPAPVPRGIADTLSKSKFPHPKLKMTKEGDLQVVGLKNTIENLAYMLREYGIVCRYNEMTRVREIYIPGAVFSKDNEVDRQLDFVYNLSVLNDMQFGRDWVSGALSSICEQDCYHPVKLWLKSKSWDKVSRLQQLIDTLEVDAEYVEHRDAVVRKWLVSAVAAIYSNLRKDKFEGCLVLQGFQGKGKTSWFMALAPAEMRSILEGHTLDPNNKDSVFTLAGHWIAELGELDTTFSKAEIGRLKGFLSNTVDKLRRPYARGDSEMKRQTVLGASVNRPDFLIDDTGNRRWWTVPVTAVNFMHGIDMQQLWAEVKTLVDTGAAWHLSAKEVAMLNSVNEGFTAVTPLAELIPTVFDFEKRNLSLVGMEAVESADTVRMTATQVVELFGMPRDRKTVAEAGATLRKLTGKDPKKSNGLLVWTLQVRKDAEEKTAIPKMCFRHAA